MWFGRLADLDKEAIVGDSVEERILNIKKSMAVDQ